MVKKYSDVQLLERVKSLSTFKYIPKGYWLLFVRSNEDLRDTFDDKLYLFQGDKFIMVSSCTTNKGDKGSGVVISDRWNYDVWRYGLHKGMVQAGLQVKKMDYRRDFTNDGKTNPTTDLKNDIRGFNFHPADHDINRNIVKTKIGGWSEGCFVVNDIPKYKTIIGLLKQQITFSMVCVDEF